MPSQMYNVEKGNGAPQEGGAEQRLHDVTRRVQEIDEEIESLRGQRKAAAEEINRAAEELQSSIEKAQYVLGANARLETQDGKW